MKYIIMPLLKTIWAIFMTAVSAIAFILSILWFLNFERAYDASINGLFINVYEKESRGVRVIVYRSIWHWAFGIL